MAINFVVRKCACGGKLEFDAQKKVWICKYCGTVVEREATFDRVKVDGIEGINDVVRQTLKDIADNKLDSASRNLEDCERKNHMHIGTLLANISFHLSNISLAKSQEEARNSLDKAKIYAKRLNGDFPVIAEEEINLYESFGEGSSDIFANLLVVFDTLNDQGRTEYIISRLKAGQVFSRHANRGLLKIAIKQGRYDMAEEIASNVNHIDKTAAFQEIADQYPDNQKKKTLIEKLFDSQVAAALSADYVEEYVETSRDSIGTKNQLIRMFSEAGVQGNPLTLVKAVYPQIGDSEAAKETFLAVYRAKVSDQETEELLDFVLLENKAYHVLIAFLDALLEKHVFVSLRAGLVIAFMDSSDLEVQARVEVLERLFQLEIDRKSLDGIYHDYLNNNQDSAEDRAVILKFLLTEGCPVSTATVKHYVIKTVTDKEKKIEVVKRIFDTGFNKTYVGDLLSEYLLESSDADTVKEEISAYFIELGFKMDSQAFTRYIISSGDDAAVKAGKARSLIENGTHIKADCLDNYLLSVQNPEDFSPDLFEMLAGSSFTLGFPAYSRYLLTFKDPDKARHNARLHSQLDVDLNSCFVTVHHNENQIVCNLLQGYVLCGNESYDTAKAVVSELMDSKVRLNTDVTVNGTAMKFKKYVAVNKATLSPLSLQLCEENRMFSLF